ncbi:hypothetical protein PYCCODRAFT_279064 [Trametes coccinea BRFM310]|uniref:Uncharacterized protein n=1 Tax=Trametes coccinea (strain BRFM310) TaxID=1353009 RepID=A0A1Y2IRY6_TRAC3|nr:hypothetical protein PYCCODRAFT_279064 [Trametes coccinea BRFM310]
MLSSFAGLLPSLHSQSLYRRNPRTRSVTHTHEVSAAISPRLLHIISLSSDTPNTHIHLDRKHSRSPSFARGHPKLSAPPSSHAHRTVHPCSSFLRILSDMAQCHSRLSIYCAPKKASGCASCVRGCMVRLCLEALKPCLEALSQEGMTYYSRSASCFLPVCRPFGTSFTRSRACVGRRQPAGAS